MSVIVHVAVAVIVNADNEVCISLRHKTSHQGDFWEFPGGKIEPEETVEQALLREIKEELNLEIKSSRPLICIRHDYHDKNVVLHVRKVLSYNGQATGLEGQQVKWLPVRQLRADEFPAANVAIINALQLPDKYLITGKFINQDDFVSKLNNALANGIRLVQLRLKNGDISVEKAQSLIRQCALLCNTAGAHLLLNVPQSYRQIVALSNVKFDGFHADSRTLTALSERPVGKLFSASCHNHQALLKAQQLKADFVVLSPVQKTASHPDMQAMGWPVFSAMVEPCTMPVYALGGVSENDLPQAWSQGAQGVAAISAFWKR